MGIPWMNADAQKQMKWRDGDIVASCGAKSGTTWTMNIIHQLRSGGDDAFDDVYEKVPWIEYVDQPGRTLEERVEKIDSMPDSMRRAFKTHSAPPEIPYFDLSAEASPNVKYVVVCRNPEEASASFFPFINNHNEEYFKAWDFPTEVVWHPDFNTFYEKFIVKTGFYKGWFDFTAKWWPLRHQSNVLMLHFTDMTKDNEGAIRKIAEFLDFQITEEQWPKVLEHCSFKWMKQNAAKFDANTISSPPILNRGAMIRRGSSGLQADDGVTEEISRDLASRGREVLHDEEAFSWLYSGGPLSPESN